MAAQQVFSSPLRNSELKWSDPIFLAVDWPSWHYIHRLKGRCRYYAETSADFSFCFQREVWVLYAKRAYFSRALSLGYAVQAHNAKKILLILLADSLIQGNRYAGYARCTH